MSRIKRQKRALAHISAPKPLSIYHGPPTPLPSPLTQAEAVLKILRPRSVARRAIMLARWADTAARLHPEQHLPLWDRSWHFTLRLLAELPWQRPLDALSTAGSIQELVRHLLCLYPTPAFLLEFFENDGHILGRAEEPRQFARLAAVIAEGGGFKRVKALIPGEFTQKVFGLFLQAPPDTLPLIALRNAQVAVLKGPSWLGEAISQHSLFASLGGNTQRWQLLNWLCRQDGLTLEELPHLLDYLAIHPDVAGRTLASIRRLVAAWAPVAPILRDYRPFTLSRLANSTVSGLEGWVFRELETAVELVVEGKVLHHCVASYAAYVRNGGTSIWSMRKDRIRQLSLEIRNESRTIVQVRGLCNRRPTAQELEIIQLWAKENQLILAAKLI
jgi:hypothetical protein